MNCVSQHSKAIKLLRQIAATQNNPQLDMAITQAEDSFMFATLTFTETENQIKNLIDQNDELSQHVQQLANI